VGRSRGKKGEGPGEEKKEMGPSQMNSVDSDLIKNFNWLEI
jgi:hypothetical protein